MFLNSGEADAIITWTAKTSAIYQMDRPNEKQKAYLKEKSVENLTCSESARTIARYVIDVLTNYDSKLLGEGQVKDIIDLTMMVGNLETEVNNTADPCTQSSRRIYVEEVQSLYDRILLLQDDIPTDSEWSNGVAALAETVTQHLRAFEYCYSQCNQKAGNSEEDWDCESNDEGSTDDASMSPPVDSWNVSNISKRSSSGFDSQEEEDGIWV